MIIEQEISQLQKETEAAVCLQGFDYIELYVGNVQQAAYFYRTAFGFTPVAYIGLETGERGESYVQPDPETSLGGHGGRRRFP